MLTSLFTSLAGELKGWVGKAFVMAVWLPVLVFACAGLAVYLAGAGALASAPAEWARRGADDKAIFLAVFVGVVTLAAFVLDFAQVPLVRLFEGYWAELPLLRQVGRRRQRRYERDLARMDERLEQLSEQLPASEGKPDTVWLKSEFNVLAGRRLLAFPPPGYESQLMPTRLGNLYKAAELYPYDRYRIDSVTVWPRLRERLPDKFVERLQEVKTGVDFLLLFSFLSALFSLLSVPYLLWQRAPASLVLACAAGLPLAWLCYRAALSPAQAYAELLKTAFDLHRHELVKALGLRVPETLAKEQALWLDISNFIYRGIPPSEDWRFEPQSAKKDEPAPVQTKK